MNRSRWSGASLLAAQTAAPFGTLLFPKVVFSPSVDSIICDKNSSIERHRPSPSPPNCAWQQWKGGVSALGRA
eukprot:1148683-Prymnesium_polylepis.1